LTDGKGSIFLTYPRTAAGEGITCTCDPNHDVTQLGVITRWTPVKNLTFSAEVMWFRLNQKFSGFATLTPTAPKPIAVYELKHQDTVALKVRVQRNFRSLSRHGERGLRLNPWLETAEGTF